MQEIVNFVVNLVGNMGYIGIYLMMTLESSFIPFPSEIAMIPAGYLSSLGQMNFVIAFIAGSSGALTGSVINYVLGFYLGGPIIKTLVHKYGKYIFLKEDHYLQAEKYFKNHGSVTTLLGRFIPAVRQLISIPAGIFKMNIAKFLLYTTIGASIWNLVLMTIGYIAGENKALIEKYSKESLIGVILFVIIIGVGYYLIHKRKNK